MVLSVVRDLQCLLLFASHVASFAFSDTPATTSIAQIPGRKIFRCDCSARRTVLRPLSLHAIDLPIRKFIQALIIAVVHKVVNRVIAGLQAASVAAFWTTIGGSERLGSVVYLVIVSS